MDFHRLARKDLQSLSKLNKLPANRSNIAMAEALSSLTIVNGIDNLFGTTESSVPYKNVVITPKTRRRNRGPVASLHSVQRVYNTRLSARLSKKTLAESEYKEQLSETLNQKIADKDLNLKGTPATNLESKVLTKEDIGLKLDSVEAVVEVPSQNIKALLDMPVITKKKGPNNVRVDCSFFGTEIQTESSNRDNGENLEAEVIGSIYMRAEVLNSKENNVTNGNAKLKSKELCCYGKDMDVSILDATDVDLFQKIAIAQNDPYSENCEGISSHNYSCDDTVADTDLMCAKQLDKEAEEHVSENHNCNDFKEIIYKSVMKVSSDSSNVFSGEKRSAEGEIVFQKAVIGLTFGFDIQSNRAKYESTGNYIIEKNYFDDTEAGSDFLQQNMSCKLFESKREPEVCEILSCNNTKEIFVPSEMAGSVESTENVSGAVSSDDELGDKHIFAFQEEDRRNVTGGKMVVDLETSSKTRACIERKAINFQVLGSTYPKDAADQSATPDSYILSDGFSGEITTYDEIGSGKSSNDTRLLVASDVSCSFLDLDNIFADESQPANAEKSPASIKSSSCICPSSFPPSLQAFETKISDEELSETDMPLEVQTIEGINDVGVDSSFFGTEMQTESSNKVERFEVDAVEVVVEVPSHNNKAAIDSPLPEKKDDVELELSLSEIDMPPEVQATEGPNNVRVDCSLFGTEIQTESSNMVDGKNLEAEVICTTYMRAEIFNGDGGKICNDNANVESNEECCYGKDVDVGIVDAADVNAFRKIATAQNDILSDEPVNDLMIKSETENIANEISDISLKIQETISCDVKSGSVDDTEEGFPSPDMVSGQPCSESCKRIETSFHQNYGDDTTPDTDLMCDKQLDKETEHVSDNLNCNNTKEIIYQSVMTVSSDSPNVFSGGKGSAEGEIVFQDGDGGLTFGVDMQSNTATYENTENYTREKNMSSKLFDSNREPKVCKILSCNNSNEFSVPSEMAGSVEYTVNFSGAVLSDDEFGDEPIFAFQEEVSSNAKEIADQSEIKGEVDSSNTCSGRITSDDENKLDFQEAVGEKIVVDQETSSKTHGGIERESIISQVLNCTYPKEAADQSATPDSYDFSDGFAGEITTYGEIESGKSSKDSRLLVASDVSCSFLDLENIGSDESQPPYVENSPASLKPSSCICPSTAPPSLQPI